jgi:hypothetical protein
MREAQSGDQSPHSKSLCLPYIQSTTDLK